MESVTQKQLDQDQISKSRVSESDPIDFEASRLCETEIFVKEVDEKAIGDISVKITQEKSKMIRKKGRKSNENVGEDKEGFESMVNMGLSEEEDEGDEEEEEEDEDVSNEFCVGDFVWVKIKSYPWWPGQIFSPVDASAKAGKYRRRNRLLVACFGDGTFAWCYPSQLKSFRENFDKFENQSSSKNFVIAVEEAVNEFGKSLDFEMGCCCLPVECRPVKSVVVNAGIKEGVVVPDGGVGELSIAKFEPAEFLAQLKGIAQVVSVSSRFELLALKCRLSGFYRAKGYNRLMEYHLPMRIVISEDIDVNGKTGGDDGTNQTANVNGSSPVEADWLSSSVDNGVGSTGITMSRRMSGLSEDILLSSKKQRNVSDLMLRNLNAEDDLTSEASPIEEPVSAKRGRPKKIREPIPSEVGKDTVEEVAVSAEMASGESKENTTSKRGRPKKIRESMPSEVGKDTGEEVAVSPEIASGESKENTKSNVGQVNDVSDELTTSTKARGRPKKITEPIPCKVGDISVEESDISQAKASGTSMETRNSNANLSNGVTEESPDSGKPGGRPKRKQNTDSDIGNDAVKKSGVSSKQVTPSGMDKKFRSSNVGDANGATEEGGVSVKGRGRPKKIREESNEDVAKDHKTKASEGGSDAVKQPGASAKQATPSSTNKKHKSITVEDADGATEEGSVSVKGRGRPKKRKEGSNEDVPEENKTKASEVASEEAVVKELPFFGKKSMELRRKKAQNSEVRKDPDIAEELSVKQISGSGKRKEKVDSRPGTDSVVGEGFDDSKQASSPKRPKEIKLPEPSLTGESSDDEDDDSGGKEGSKSNVSLRERKKSKYLSPPYTLLGQWRKESGTDDSRKKSPRSPHSSQERFPPMVKCIGVASETQPSKDAKLESGTRGGLSPLPIESNTTAHEILSDFRSAAQDPLCLTEKQSDDAVKGFMTKFRSSSYQEGSDFMCYNKQLGGGGNRKRVSFEVTGNETGDPISEDASKGKKRKKKNDEVLPSPKKPVDSNGEISVAALLLTFTPGVSLPSKDEIIKAIRPFGDLNESETEVIEDSGCAQVVFANRSDAEEAYKNTDKITSFGSSVASFRLRYLSAKNARPSPIKGVSTASEASVVPPPPLLSVRQNLQKAETVLEKLWDNLSSEMKTSLDAEIKGFLGKVTSMRDATSS